MPKLARGRQPGGVSGGLRAARAWAWLSLDELAQATGIGRTQLHRFETGASSPSADDVQAVATATGVPAHVIVGGLDSIVLAAR